MASADRSCRPASIAICGGYVRLTVKELLQLLKLTHNHVGQYFSTLLVLVLGTTAFLFIPRQFGQLVVGLQRLATGHNDTVARNAVFAIAGLLAFQAITSLVHSFLVALTSEQIVNELRARFFRA